MNIEPKLVHRPDLGADADVPLVRQVFDVVGQQGNLITTEVLKR